MTGIVAEASVPLDNQWLFGANVVGLELQDMSDAAATDDDFMCNTAMDGAPSRRRKGSLPDASVVTKKKHTSKRSGLSDEGPRTVPECALDHRHCDQGAPMDPPISVAPRNTQLSRERRGGGAMRKKKLGSVHPTVVGGGNDSTDDGGFHNDNTTSSSFGLLSPKDWVSVDTSRAPLDSPTDEWYRPPRDGDGMGLGFHAEGTKSDGCASKKRASKASRHHLNHFDDSAGVSDPLVSSVDPPGGAQKDARRRSDASRVAPMGSDGKKLSSTSVLSTLTDEARSGGITGGGGSDDWQDDSAVSSSTTAPSKGPQQHHSRSGGAKPPHATHNPWNMGTLLGPEDAMQFESIPNNGGCVSKKQNEKNDRSQPRDQGKKQRRTMSKDTSSGGGGRSHHRESSFVESADESFASLTFTSMGGGPTGRGLPRLGQQGNNSPGSQYVEVDALAAHAPQQHHLLQTTAGWSLASLGALPPILSQPGVPSSKHGRTASYGAS